MPIIDLTSVCQQDNSRSLGRIWTKFSWSMVCGTVTRALLLCIVFISFDRRLLTSSIHSELLCLSLGYFVVVGDVCTTDYSSSISFALNLKYAGHFLPAWRSKRGICYGDVAGWLAGWVCVCHSRYCIKTTKSILKLFWPSRSPSFKLFWVVTHCTNTNSKGNPIIGGVKYTGVRKLAIFDGYRHLSRKQCEIVRWLLWNVNRKSWVPDWMV